MGAMPRPPPQLTVSAWAERHRILGSRASSEPGPWRTSRTPYLREIMDALSAVHPARRVVFMKGAQVGAPLAIDTPIPTAEGWATIGALIVGDTLFDEHGRPRRGRVAGSGRRNAWRPARYRPPQTYILATGTPRVQAAWPGSLAGAAGANGPVACRA